MSVRQTYRKSIPNRTGNFGNGILPTVFHTFMKTKNIPDAMPVTKSAYRHRQIAM